MVCSVGTCTTNTVQYKRTLQEDGMDPDHHAWKQAPWEGKSEQANGGRRRQREVGGCVKPSMSELSFVGSGLRVG